MSLLERLKNKIMSKKVQKFSKTDVESMIRDVLNLDDRKIKFTISKKIVKNGFNENGSEDYKIVHEFSGIEFEYED